MNISPEKKQVLKKTALNRLTLAGKLSLLGIILVTIVAIFAPYISPHDPMETNPERRWADASGYPLGCDNLGQCILSRIIHGARLSLLIGFASRILALLIGLIVGLTAGYFGGWLDWALMRVVDMFLAFPSLLLSIAISMFMGSGLGTVIFAIAIVGWAEMARIIRSATLELRSAEYVVAAKTLGATDLRIMLTHILPNCMPIITVIFTMGMATAVLSEASLSFLGLGVDPSLPTWGGMVATGKDFMISNPSLVIYPGLCIAFLVIVFNVFGDELRDILDPSRKGNF
ncbi:MAG: ABC transporter permease [Candidatus Riflebacteria bacterium]|jgi:ABC-type dipeptide/oligopeptide/nickel transport system permease subunit|nr:ABC transporter permease [Candidatus Riflebacteria bacterium]